ncbi:hypothetical protein RCL1_003733 [Eukaryota sp. TZLM3-RCL]
MFVTNAFSSAVGIGGGAFLTPILVVCFDISFSLAFALSKAIIFAGMIASFLVDRKDPDSHSSLPTALFVVSPMLAGTVLGVLANVTFPFASITVLLTILLSQSGIKSLKKGLKSLKEKSTTRLPETSPTEGKEMLDMEKMEEAEENSTPSSPSITLGFVLFACGSWVLVLFITTIRGSRAVDSIIGIPLCSILFWFLTFVQVPIAAGCSYLSLKVTKPTPVWSFEKAWKLFFVALLSGLIAAMLGVGGAMVLTPYLMNMGLTVIEARSTSILVVLFSSSSSFVQYALFGTFDFSIASVQMIIAFISSWLGMVVISRYLKKTGKKESITVLLGVMILVSMVVIVFVSVLRIVQSENFIENFKFHNFCV